MKRRTDWQTDMAMLIIAFHERGNDFKTTREYINEKEQIQN
jgi:hypothetical protein